MFSHLALSLLVVTGILAILALVAVGLRFYCRHLQECSFGSDDYLILVALFLSTGVNVITDYLLIKTGVGYVPFAPSKEDLVVLLKIASAIETVQTTAVGICKVSLLLFYRRILTVDWFRRSNNVLIVLVSCLTFAIVMSLLFSKWPIYEQWNPQAEYDVNLSAVFMVFSTLNAVFDFAILGLPLIAVRRLQAGLQRKLFLSTRFTFGSICVVASLFRLYYCVLSLHSSETDLNTYQVSYMHNALWANFETPGFIITGTLLSFGPVFRGLQRSFAKTSTYLRSSFTSKGNSNASSSTVKIGDRDIRKCVTIEQVRKNGVIEEQAVRRLDWELNHTSSSETSI